MAMQADEMKTLRERIAMTQADLAEALGISRKTIIRMEAGEEIDRRTELALRYLLRLHLERIESDRVRAACEEAPRDEWFRIAQRQADNWIGSGWVALVQDCHGKPPRIVLSERTPR